MSKEVSRRDVLKGSAAAVVGVAASSALASAPQPLLEPKGGKLRVGIIACGGKGWSGMMGIAEHGEIVALCDIDANARAKAMAEFPRASTFDDYRIMLESMRGRMDAVVISTPDHHHAPASAMAMKMGLHTYCEKPLCRTIWEARMLARIARDKRVATQMGNQSTASTMMRKVAAMIQRGDFGTVKEIHLWTDRAGGWWKQGIPRPEPKPAPKPVDFELWLGPRPDRPYGDGYHPFAWRGWWDFGTGSLGDMGCHIFNMPHMALGLSNPLAVTAETSGHDKDSFPAWAKVKFEFGARRNQPAFNVFWYDGGQKPDAALAPEFKYGGNGVLVICEKATIFSPDEFNTNFMLSGGMAMPEIEVDESPGHMAEFARAATGGKPARSNFPDYSGPLTEAVLLGNLAIWANGPRLEWDARRMQVKGTNEFDALIKPAFRPGWSV